MLANCVLIPTSAAHEEHVYVFSLQIMEDFRTAEEAYPARVAVVFGRKPAR